MKEEGLAVKSAIARARSVFPGLYASDKAITRNFTDPAWFNLISEARAIARAENIPLGDAFTRIYQENPALLMQLLGREQL
jgi:hypothetical protein